MMPTWSLTEMRTAEHGFTLIELLAVMTIMGLVAAVGVNQFGRSPSAVTRSRTAGLLRAQIAAAERASASSGQPVAVTLAALPAQPGKLQLVPRLAGSQDQVLQVFADGSTTGGTVLLDGRPLLTIDWLTGEVRDAAR
jgi:prepilin-type N-terminal cleavage/methylation domain-containing protein